MKRYKYEKADSDELEVDDGWDLLGLYCFDLSWDDYSGGWGENYVCGCGIYQVRAFVGRKVDGMLCFFNPFIA